VERVEKVGWRSCVCLCMYEVGGCVTVHCIGCIVLIYVLCTDLIIASSSTAPFAVRPSPRPYTYPHPERRASQSI
jgi:hypothetical protein